MKRFWTLCVAAVFAVTLAGAAGWAPAASAETYKLGVSKAGGAWYPIGTALQRLAEKEYGDKITLDIGGGMANTLNALSGKIDFGITYNSTVVDAFKGRGPFKGKDASDLQLAAVQYNQMMMWVVWADSGITHWSQLKGKRVNAMPKAFSSHALNKQMLEGVGMSLADFPKVLTLGFNDAVAQMKDGHIDVYLGPGERDYAPIMQLAAHKPIRILEFSDEDIKKIQAINSAMIPVTLEKKYYNQPKDVQVIETFQIMVTNRKVPEERVYKLAKLMYENLDYMTNVNKEFGRVEPKKAAQDIGVPRHPGLTRYLKEKGLL